MKTLKQLMQAKHSPRCNCLFENEIKAVREWLEQKRNDYLDKQDITKYDTLPETYQWLESRVKFIDELLEELNAHS